MGRAWMGLGEACVESGTNLLHPLNRAASFSLVYDLFQPCSSSLESNCTPLLTPAREDRSLWEAPADVGLGRPRSLDGLRLAQLLWWW